MFIIRGWVGDNDIFVFFCWFDWLSWLDFNDIFIIIGGEDNCKLICFWLGVFVMIFFILILFIVVFLFFDCVLFIILVLDELMLMFKVLEFVLDWVVEDWEWCLFGDLELWVIVLWEFWVFDFWVFWEFFWFNSMLINVGEILGNVCWVILIKFVFDCDWCVCVCRWLIDFCLGCVGEGKLLRLIIMILFLDELVFWFLCWLFCE